MAITDNKIFLIITEITYHHSRTIHIYKTQRISRYLYKQNVSGRRGVGGG
jgi:hypothetical protein